MKHYIDPITQAIYAYGPSDSQDAFIKPGLVPISDADLATLRTPLPPTKTEIIASVTESIQAHLDATARTHGYDGILSACTYATSTIAKFKAEGQACVNWRDSVWSTCYVAMVAVESGKLEAPTADALIASLPAMEWPV
jgi:hypothetical protein